MTDRESGSSRTRLKPWQWSALERERIDADDQVRDDASRADAAAPTPPNTAPPPGAEKRAEQASR